MVGVLVSAIVSGRFRFQSLSEAATDTLKVTTMILRITIGARAFVSVFVATGGADSILTFVENIESSRWIILFAMVGVLIFWGFFWANSAL